MQVDHKRLRMAAAIMLVLSAALFAAGTAIERSSREESGTHLEEPEGGEHAEAGESEEGGSPSGEVEGEESDETLFGVDPDSPLVVAAGVAASLLMAAAVWRSRSRWLLSLVAAAAVVFAVLDVREVAHQVRESNGGLMVLALVVAALHLGAALSAGLATRATQTP